MKTDFIKKVMIAGLGIMIIYGCATVPVTGRKQLNLGSNEELLPMSFQQYEQVLNENKLSTIAEWTAMVKRSGARIQKAAEQYLAEQGHKDYLDGYKWEFNLIESETVNAWCMPGGKVAFYTGIMPICQDETGVAVVMGHEIAHAIANHGRERMSEQLAANGLLGGLSAAVGQNPTLAQEVLLQSAGIGTQLGMLAYSRTHESEADEIGLIFMAMAGYDPREAPEFWKRMDRGGELPPEFLSTHPHPATRIKDLEAQIPNAMKYYKPE